MTQTTKIQLQDHVAAMFKFNATTPVSDEIIARDIKLKQRIDDLHAATCGNHYSQPTKDSNMLKPATTTDIEKMISGMVASAEMFTNYDVTKKLRATGFHVMHNDVKAVVSGYDFPYYYASTTTHATGMPALLHYPDHKDSKQYDPKAIPEPAIPVALKKVTVNQRGAVSATATVNDPSTIAAIKAGTGIAFKCGNFSSQSGSAGPQGMVGNPGTHVITGHTHKATRVVGSDTTIDKRGRCHVAARFMKQAGFESNATVKVNVNVASKKIYITDVFDTSTGGLIEIDYTTDNHTAVRIAASTFQKAFKYSDVVKVTVERKKVTLSL